MASLESGYGMRPCTRDAFDQCLRMVRVIHRHRLDQKVINRDGQALGTVFLVGEDPIAFYGSDGQHYVRQT